MAGEKDKAVVLVPEAGDTARWVAACYDACERQGIEVVGVLPPGDWRKAAQLFAEGKANVMAVARRDHIPPDAPRVLVAAEHPAEAKARHRNRSLIDRRRRPRTV